MNRAWTDLHPKILAALLTLVVIIGIVWLARVALGVDLNEDFRSFATTVLPLVAGYLKSGD